MGGRLALRRLHVEAQHSGMNAKILLIANLFLVSLLIWPPGGSLLSFQFSAPDMLLRMAAAIWIWVGAMLVGQYYVLRNLQHRRRSSMTAEPRTDSWTSFTRERRSGDRRAEDRRQQDGGPPSGQAERRHRERRSGARRSDDGIRRSESDEQNWRYSVVSQAG